MVAALCGIETVSSNDVQSVLKEVDDELAKIELSGHVEGRVSGQTTKIQLKAKYRFQRKSGRISWFGLLVQENRSPGPMGPGLDVVARLQVKISPTEHSDHLSDLALKDLAVQPTPELERLCYVSPGGGWQLEYDRRWVLINDKPHEAVFRLADSGSYLAECTISESAPRAGQKPISLKQFQVDIQQALGKNLRRFVQAAETSDEGDYRVYRVRAEGEVSNTPVEWIYCLIFDKQNHRAVLAFTVNQNTMEQFEPFAQQLAQALRFAAVRTASKP